MKDTVNTKYRSVLDREEANRRIALRTAAKTADSVVETIEEYDAMLETTARRRLEQIAPSALRLRAHGQSEDKL
jgi:hypothetical protein